MATVYVSKIIDASVKDVWDLVRPLDSYKDWFPELKNCRVENGETVDKVGAIRRFEYDGHVIRERMVELSDLDHRSKYTIVENPVTPDVENYVGELEFTDITEDHKTLGTWQSRFDGPPEAVENTRTVVTEVFKTGLQHIQDAL